MTENATETNEIQWPTKEEWLAAPILGTRLLIKRRMPSDVSEGGIKLVESTIDYLPMGLVLSVGPKANESGYIFEVGDFVHFDAVALQTLPALSEKPDKPDIGYLLAEDAVLPVRKPA